MAATIHFISKATGNIYGFHGTFGLNVLDDMIAEHLGITPNPEEWCNGWHNTIAYDFAMNVSLKDVRENIKKHEQDYPELAERYKMSATLDYLIENFYIRNDWGEESTIKELDYPITAKRKSRESLVDKKRRAGVK